MQRIAELSSLQYGFFCSYSKKIVSIRINFVKKYKIFGTLLPWLLNNKITIRESLSVFFHVHLEILSMKPFQG